MLSIISPAKTQDFNILLSDISSSSPYFSDKMRYILSKCRNLSQGQIKQLMNISDKLTEINYYRLQNFANQPQKPAIFAYDGDVYDNIDRANFTAEQLDFVQHHMLIISGLYGALRPLDNIQAYRLEMSAKLNLPNFKKLSDFWQADITNHINSILATHQNQYLINLASKEYSSAINANNLEYPMINIHFKEKRHDKLQVIAINAKKARGAMLNFIAKNLIDLPKQLKHFTDQNYLYSNSLSSEEDWIFIKNS